MTLVFMDEHNKEERIKIALSRAKSTIFEVNNNLDPNSIIYKLC